MLSTTDLGDRKLSVLVNYLLTLLGSHGLEILLQKVFLPSLPSHIQGTLAGCDGSDLESLGDQADEIMDHPHGPALTAFSTISQDPFLDILFPGPLDSTPYGVALTV